MEWIERLNVLQEKIKGLLELISRLKSENESLLEENIQLNDDIAALKLKLEAEIAGKEKFFDEKEAIKERIERLIQMIE